MTVICQDLLQGNGKFYAVFLWPERSSNKNGELVSGDNGLLLDLGISLVSDSKFKFKKIAVGWIFKV